MDKREELADKLDIILNMVERLMAENDPEYVSRLLPSSRIYNLLLEIFEILLWTIKKPHYREFTKNPRIRKYPPMTRPEISRRLRRTTLSFESFWAGETTFKEKAWHQIAEEDRPFFEILIKEPIPNGLQNPSAREIKAIEQIMLQLLTLRAGRRTFETTKKRSPSTKGRNTPPGVKPKGNGRGKKRWLIK